MAYSFVKFSDLDTTCSSGNTVVVVCEGWLSNAGWLKFIGKFSGI